MVERAEPYLGREFIQKLGIKPGHSVAALNAPPFLRGLLRTLMPPEVRYQTDLAAGDRPDVVLFWPDDGINLASAFADLRQRIPPDGAVWAVIPKRPVADKRGPRVYFDQMLAAALPTGLVDNKTLTFSQDEYGIRFVIRRELRKIKPWEADPVGAPS
ncbi:MAG: DUF3052 family protein [Chloroflexi bacterium]|nr:DUF3052 family protein [Chloroflexota bacterium]